MDEGRVNGVAGASAELNPPKPHVGSLLRSLCFRELGLFDNANAITATRIGSGDFYTATTRQLMRRRLNAIPLMKGPDAFRSKNNKGQAEAFGRLPTEAEENAWHLDTKTGFVYHKQKRHAIVTYNCITHRPLIGRQIVGKELQMIDAYLYLYQMIENQGYTYNCFEYDYQSGLLKRRYALQDIPKPWKDISTWYPTIEMIPNQVVSAKPILVTLSNNEKELITWDLDSGNKLQRIGLDEKISFKNMVTREKFIYLEGKKAHVLGPAFVGASFANYVFDGILADVQDITKTARFKVRDSGFPFRLTGGYLKAEMIDDMLLFGHSNKMKIVDLFSTLEKAKLSVSNRSALSCSSSNNSVPISHVISDVPKVLYETESKGSYLEMSDAGCPPHMIRINHKNRETFIMDMLTGKKVLNHGILSMKLQAHDDEEASLHFHPDESSRVIYCRANLIRIFRLVRSITESGTPGPSKLEEELSCEFKGLGHLEMTINSVRCVTITNSRVEERRERERRIRARAALLESSSGSGSGSQRPRRANTDYDMKRMEELPSIKYEYAPHIKSLVVVEVNPGHDRLFFHYFDNNTWERLFTLNPDKLKMKHIENMHISDFTFQILEEVIIVRKNQAGTKIVNEIMLLPVF